MAILKITAAKDSGNDIVDSDGVPVDLDALNASKVVVEDCDGVYAFQGPRIIDSDSTAVSFTGSQLMVEFGQLQLKPGTYSPKIYYVTATAPLGEVIVGEGYATEIILTAVC